MPAAKQGRSLFIPITKVDEEKRIVYGVLTAEVVDKSGEILDYDSAKLAFQKWSDDQFAASGGKSKGNLREMHSNIAAGIFTDLVFDDELRQIEGATYISNDSSWTKVNDGTLTGFSIGGGYEKRWNDPDNIGVKRYTPNITEVSLVDSPCVGIATFEVIKADGSVELRKFHPTLENPMTIESTMPAVAQPEQVWKATDGSTHSSKKDALKKNAELAAPANPLVTEAADALKKLEDVVASKETPASEAAPAAEGTEAAPAADEIVDKPADAPVEGAVEEPAAPAAEATPAVVEKVAETPEGEKPLRKSLWQVSRAADLLQSLVYFQSDVACEADWEADGSPLPAELKAAIVTLLAWLKEFVAEEVSEIFPADAVNVAIEKGAPIDALAKFIRSDLVKAEGADVPALEGFADTLEKASKAATAHMGAMADHLGTMKKSIAGMDKCMKGLGLGDDDADEADDVKKLAKMAGDNERILAENDELKKSLGSVIPAMSALTERLAKVEAMPAAGGAVTRTVTRSSEEGAGIPSAEDNLLKFANGSSSPAECAAMASKLLMKATLANPQAM